MPRSQWAYLCPRPTFLQVRQGYLYHRDGYHSVERMPSSFFKTIILERYPSFAHSDAVKLQSLDVVDRWHVLMRYPLKVYKKGECC